MHARTLFALPAVLALLLTAARPEPASAAPQEELARAARQGEVAFILVTDAAAGADEARELIRQAMRQVERSTMVEIDRSAPANAALVAQYRLAGAPVPMVLVAGRNGAVAGGLYAAQATVQRLVDLVPSPKKAEILGALGAGKAVFLCAGRKGMSARSAALASCASACDQAGGKCVTVEVDMDDPAERGFLTQLGIDPAAAEPVTLVINAAGQIAGTYAGAVEAVELVQATTRRVGGCCPPTAAGGSSSCGPQKK